MRVLVNGLVAPSPTYELRFQTGAALSAGEYLRFAQKLGRAFDEYHLLAPHAGGPNAPGSKTRHLSFDEFPAAARAYGSGILFNRLAAGARLRARYVPVPMPVVEQNQSVSYSCFAAPILLDLMCGLRSYDCLVALTRPHLEAARRLYERTARECAPLLAGLGPVRLPRFELIHAGIDCSVFDGVDRGESRRRLGLPPDATVLLSLSRITISDKMDFLPLLRGFHQAFRSRPEVLLVVAGESKLSNHLEVTKGLVERMGLSAQVRFLSGAPIRDAYGAADVFVSPNDTVTESFCRTAVEAMAAGLPVVVSDWDGLRDTVVDGVTGFRAPTLWGDAQGHAEAIRPIAEPPHAHMFVGQSVAVDMDSFYRRVRLLVENPGLRERMGAAGRARARTEFDWRVLVPRYEALYEDLMAEAARDTGAHVRVARAEGLPGRCGSARTA